MQNHRSGLELIDYDWGRSAGAEIGATDPERPHRSRRRDPAHDHLEPVRTLARWELIKTELEPFTLQWYGLSEFSAMLHDAGFPHMTVHAGYQAGQHPAEGSRIWTFEATHD